MKYILFTVIAFFTIAIVEAKEPPSIESQYIVALNSPVIAQNWPRNDLYADNCVMYAKYVLGHSGALGVAKDIKPNTQTPVVGGIVLTSEGQFGHVAVILEVSDTSLLVTEANYIPDTISTRSIQLDDPSIRGYLVLE